MTNTELLPQERIDKLQSSFFPNVVTAYHENMRIFKLGVDFQEAK